MLTISEMVTLYIQKVYSDLYTFSGIFHYISMIKIFESNISRIYTKIFRRKDITLTRNRVIRICIQNTLVPPIAGYF